MNPVKQAIMKYANGLIGDSDFFEVLHEIFNQDNESGRESTLAFYNDTKALVREGISLGDILHGVLG